MGARYDRAVTKSTMPPRAIAELIDTLPLGGAFLLWELSTVKIEEAVQQWILAGRGARWGSARSAEWYQHNVERYLAWVTSDGRSATWHEPATIERYLASERERGMSPSTLRARYVSLRAFFDYLIKRKWFAEPNPLSTIDRPKVPKDKRPRSVELAELRQLLASVGLVKWSDLRDRVILQLLFFSGLRVSELVGLHVTDVDIGRALVIVRSAKGDKDRPVPCLPALGSDLLAYLYSRPAWNGPELFLSNDGAGHASRVLTVEGVRQMLRRRCKKIGIRILNPHAFRHGFAMTTLNAGLEMSAVSTAMGHSSVKVTEQFYARWQIDALQAQYNEVVKKL